MSFQNLEDFSFEETKKNVINYFRYLEMLHWELEKINAGKGLTANYDFSVEYKKQPYSPVGKDEFNLSAKDYKEEQIKKHISSYYWAKSVLAEEEQLYIDECFINRKSDDELVDLFGFNSSDSNEFRNLKRSAVYKFADFLNLVVEKDYGVLK